MLIQTSFTLLQDQFIKIHFRLSNKFSFLRHVFLSKRNHFIYIFIWENIFGLNYMFAGIIIYRFEAINDQFSKLFIYQVVSYELLPYEF